MDSHLETCEMLFDVHHGDFVAVDLISPGSTHAVVSDSLDPARHLDLLIALLLQIAAVKKAFALYPT